MGYATLLHEISLRYPCMDERADVQLVHQYLMGDRAALDVLIQRFLGRVYRFVLRYARNAHDAEDITQETFVRMWRNLKQFDRDRNFTTWMFQIAKHAAIDYARRNARHASVAALDAACALGALDAQASRMMPRLDDLLGRVGDARAVIVMLERLPANDRLVLILRYQRELTFREIGEELGEPLHTVKSRHRRALVRLRTALDTLGADALRMA